MVRNTLRRTHTFLVRPSLEEKSRRLPPLNLRKMAGGSLPWLTARLTMIASGIVPRMMPHRNTGRQMEPKPPLQGGSPEERPGLLFLTQPKTNPNRTEPSQANPNQLKSTKINLN